MGRRPPGIEVTTLDPEATLIHLAVHALEAWFHGFKLLHLYDVAWTIARWRDRSASSHPATPARPTATIANRAATARQRELGRVSR